MKFHMAALLALVVLQLSPHRIERVTDNNIDVFMCMMLSGRAACDAFIAWRSDVDGDAVDVALVMMLMRRLNRNPATDYLVTITLQPFGTFTDVRLDGIRRLKIVKVNLQRHLHDFSLRRWTPKDRELLPATRAEPGQLLHR